MSGRVVLFEHRTWQIARPAVPLVPAHVVLRAADGPGLQDPAGAECAADLLDAYRIARAGLVTDPGPDACDGCSPEVEREQELWRASGVRVIRPRTPVIGAGVLVMPVRHVASPASLEPSELTSYAERLREIHAEFGERSGSSGLSCFLNDGARAGQETPHVHLHVFGRSVDEPRNPFDILARHLGLGSVKGQMRTGRSW